MCLRPQAGKYPASTVHSSSNRSLRIWISHSSILWERGKVPADLWWWMGPELPILYWCSWQKLDKDRWGDRNKNDLPLEWCSVPCWLSFILISAGDAVVDRDFTFETFPFSFCLNISKSLFLNTIWITLGLNSWIKPGALGSLSQLMCGKGPEFLSLNI